MAEKTCGVDFIAGFLVGALAGAAAALLLAPQSGEETRVMLRDKGIELGQRAGDIQIQAKGKATELQTKVKQAVDEGKVTATKKKEELLTQVGKGQAPEATPVADA
jgi:gas vesicle protein